MRLATLLASGLAFGLPALPVLPAEPAAGPVTLPAPEELKRIIHEQDRALFAITFETCDIEALKPMLADDLEFYHDKGGLVARSATDFIAITEKNCAARRAPDAWRSRRELIESSLRVDPIPGYGAMEIGEHRFHERRGDGPEKAVGIAGFSQVWKLEDGRWKISRVLSYGHRPLP
ncbi:nuclear transport factor 2 family protein [Pseudoxanthomonas beigongshangi]